MEPIELIKDVVVDGIAYVSGDKIQVKNIDELVKLNEGGFISPLSLKELQSFFKKTENKKIEKEE